VHHKIRPGAGSELCLRAARGTWASHTAALGFRVKLVDVDVGLAVRDGEADGGSRGGGTCESSRALVGMPLVDGVVEVWVWVWARVNGEG